MAVNLRQKTDTFHFRKYYAQLKPYISHKVCMFPCNVSARSKLFSKVTGTTSQEDGCLLGCSAV
jgi:quinol monooxygenase YgiN